MATRGSTTDASDEVFDYLCSPCSKKGKNIEAVKFCVDCQEYLCVNHVEHHNSFSVLAGHTLVGRSKFGNPSGAVAKKTPSVPTERCALHPLKLIDMYCADHDSVGCHVCFTINHKPCQGIHYIPEYIQTRPLTEDLRKIKDEIEKSISKLNLALKSRKENIEENRRSKSTYLEEIRAFRKEINETLDRLEKASVTKVTETCSKRDRELQEELNALENKLQSLNACKIELESSQGNQSQQFVKTKLCENKLSSAEQKVTEPNVKHEEHINFERNLEILRYLQSRDSLNKQAQPRKQSLYKIVGKASYSVKQSTDTFGCYVSSSCILDSGDILLTDLHNYNIKLVDGKTYKKQHTLNMSDEPQSVCKISSEEAAVSLSNKTVQFVSTKNQLKPTRSLKFNHTCRGIAVMHDQLVVGEDCEKKIHFYTMKGEIIKTIEKDQSGGNIFDYIREICVSSDGLKIHVTDGKLGLITIDREGDVVWKYSGQEMQNAWGVCTDGNGNVFVSGETSNNVVQIGLGGKYLGEVVSKAHGIMSIRTVCFDKKKSKLIVSGYGHQLHVFDIIDI